MKTNKPIPAYDVTKTGLINPGLVPFERLSAEERLQSLQQRIRQTMGDDWDPVVRLAQIAEEALAEDDKKTAIAALGQVADRMHGKIKAIEITDKRAEVIVVHDSSSPGNTDGDSSLVTD